MVLINSAAGSGGEDDSDSSSSSSDEEDGLHKTTLCQQFWRHVEALPARSATMRQWILLAQLIFVMVPGSVEEERMFSAMKYLKNLWRNKLSAEHLTLCARAFRHPRVDLATFPYPVAIRLWLEGRKRRMLP